MGPDALGGWGTVEGKTLKVLVVAGPDRRVQAEGIARALGGMHQATVFSPDKTGFGSGIGNSLALARAVRELEPDLIHVVGVDGVAKAAGQVAAGSQIPLIASLNETDLARKSQKRAVRLGLRVHGLILETEADADAFRAAGVDRDIYVTEHPGTEAGERDRLFLGALEVIYGRIAQAEQLDLDDRPAPPTDTDGTPLVSIGGVRRRTNDASSSAAASPSSAPPREDANGVTGSNG